VSARVIDLGPYRNSTIATANDERGRGALNAWGNSFPAEELPFGGWLEVGGGRFWLAPRRPGAADNVEPLGQELRVEGPGGGTDPEGGAAGAGLPAASAPAGLDLLCCGEMGEQRLAMSVRDLAGGEERVLACAPAAIWSAGREPPPEAWIASHLHYPGGYELGGRLAALWRVVVPLAGRPRVGAIRLGVNPLFHLVALNLSSGS
jgi:hypothetical protein